MGVPYTPVSISGYNSNPPVDDGTASEANRVKWATIKTKLNDPTKTLAETINTNITAAMAKVVGGGGVTSTSTNYTVLSTDQGKLIRASTGSITITTPDATDVGEPFVFAVLNNSSASIILDGSGSQTIDGSATVTLQPGAGVLLFTNGSNWFTAGLPGVLAGTQIGYGDIVNATLTESNASNAVTFAIKTLAGTDPSATDPVVLAFRNATATTGNYVYRTITAALSLTLSSGSTLGATSGEAFRVWLVIFDDGGTLRLGAVNCRSGTNIFSLGRAIASSTAEGGAGGADSAQVFYTGTAVTSKPYLIIGFATYGSGLASAGSWNVSPGTLQLFGHGIPMPGTTVQEVYTQSSDVATGTTQTPYDDTIPQITEGDQYMSLAITLQSAANILDIEHRGQYSTSAGSTLTVALHQDATAGALAAVSDIVDNSRAYNIAIKHRMVGGTVSATTMRIRAGAGTASTTTFNGLAGARKYGGVASSHLQIRELMT